MKTNIQTKGIALTAALRSYVVKKIDHLEKLLDPADDAVLAVVDIGKTTKHHMYGTVFRAEVHLRLSGKDLYAASEKDDLYAAIDDMKDEIVREVTKYRTKKKRITRTGGRAAKKYVRKEE